MRYEVNRHLALYGSKKEIEQSLAYLKDDIAACVGITPSNEGETRLIIQQMMECKLVTAGVLLNGNSVYNKTKILRNLRSMVKHGKMSLMTHYTYEFMQHCGSIAHFNKAGWIASYPTISHLRSFFIKNEYGRRVLASQSPWATDSAEIIKEIEKLLQIT